MESDIQIKEISENFSDLSIMKMMGQKAHVWVTLGKGEKKAQIKALLDTGNTIMEETAITRDLHDHLNAGF